jgi:hypothetical protein
MHSPQAHGKLLVLAILWFSGLALIALSFVSAAPNVNWPHPSSFITWGICCLLIAVVWMYWDRKRRRLTPDEALDQLLSEIARRYRRTRSLDAVTDEYRAAGASDDTLRLIKSAPQMLKTRAEAKLILGVQLFVTGIILTGGAFLLSRYLGFSHYEVAIGAIGGGVGFIIDGLRQKRAFKD